MFTWYTRDLVLIAVGAVVAFAVTVHNSVFDVSVAGFFVMCAAALDLVIRLVLRSMSRPRPQRAHVERWVEDDTTQRPVYPAPYGSPEPSGRRAATRWFDEETDGERTTVLPPYRGDRADGSR